MNIGLLASNAAKAFFESLDLESIDNVYSVIEDPANEGDTANNHRTPPCVIFWCEGATEYPDGSGNWNLDLHARVVANGSADLTADDFADLYEEAFENLYTSAIATDLSAAITGFHCFGLSGPVTTSAPAFDGLNRVAEMILPINCCPSDIS